MRMEFETRSEPSLPFFTRLEMAARETFNRAATSRTVSRTQNPGSGGGRGKPVAGVVTWCSAGRMCADVCGRVRVAPSGG
jgi:hypothetical protein